MTAAAAPLLACLAFPLVLACTYLLLLTVASLATPERPAGSARTRFEVVVPAHDEEAGLGRTLASLQSLDYPTDLFRIVVVADNCMDATAAIASSAGVSVLERHDEQLRGKGYALAHAFESAGPCDAFAIVDADSVVSPNLLRAMDARLERGAAAVQCDYAVGNAHASWRTEVMAVAFGAFHATRSRGREALGLSCGLRGNGMAFAASALRDVPYRAFSLVEDVEYGLALGEAGRRVVHAAEAHVFGEMVSGERASRSQRRRWEAGRAELRARAGALAYAALRGRDAVRLDLALDLLVPPLSTLAVAVGTGTAASLGLWMGGGGRLSGTAVFEYAWCGACLFLHMARGWQLSRTGARGLASLLFAPVYVVWKLVLGRGGSASGGPWLRTRREGERTVAPAGRDLP